MFLDIEALRRSHGWPPLPHGFHYPGNHVAENETALMRTANAIVAGAKPTAPMAPPDAGLAAAWPLRARKRRLPARRRRRITGFALYDDIDPHA